MSVRLYKNKITVGADTIDTWTAQKQGAKGDKGNTGPQGVSVPAGGTTGQILTKKSNTDYDMQWTTYNPTFYVCSVSELFVTTAEYQANYTLKHYNSSAAYELYVNGFHIPNGEWSINSSGVVTMQNPPELKNQEVELVGTWVGTSASRTAYNS